MLTHTTMDYDERFRQEDSSIIEIKALKKIFEDRPVKSTVTISYKCSVCGKDVSIDITNTSGGFGFNGAFFLEYSFGTYIVTCRDCYDLTSVNP